MTIGTKHLQFSALAGLVAVCGLTIGFAGAQETAMPDVIRTFILSSPNSVTEGPFAGAKFDIAGYISHPCYDINGTEVDSCMYNYGLSTPLRTYIDNGMLALWFGNGAGMPASSVSDTSSSASSVRSGDALSSESSEPSMEETSDESMMSEPAAAVLNDSIQTEEDFYNLREARSVLLWELCTAKNADHGTASVCFQKNMRLLMRLDVELNDDTMQW